MLLVYTDERQANLLSTKGTFEPHSVALREAFGAFDPGADYQLRRLALHMHVLRHALPAPGAVNRFEDTVQLSCVVSVALRTLNRVI